MWINIEDIGIYMLGIILIEDLVIDFWDNLLEGIFIFSGYCFVLNLDIRKGINI